MRKRQMRQVEAVVARLLSLFFLALGLVLFIKGAYKAHIFRGLGVDPRWQQASAESLLITGGLIIGFALLMARTAGRRRRRLALYREMSDRKIAHLDERERQASP